MPSIVGIAGYQAIVPLKIKDKEIGPAAQEALGTKELLKFRKLGPGKPWKGRSKASELIQDHHFFPA